MPRLRVESPTISFKKVIAIAESNEWSATRRFSERMLSSTGFTCDVDTAHSSNFRRNPFDTDFFDECWMMKEFLSSLFGDFWFPQARTGSQRPAPLHENSLLVARSS